MSRRSNYDPSPVVAVKGYEDACNRGWTAVRAALTSAVDEHRHGKVVVAIECYAGVDEKELLAHLGAGIADLVIATRQTVFRQEAEIDAMVAKDIGGNDPLFGFYSELSIDDFLDRQKLAQVRSQVSQARGVVLLLGTGAVRCGEADVVVYADMPRWEGQLRQRRGEVDNLGTTNRGLKASLQYKRSFFVDWRVCDRIKQELLPRLDYFLDTTVANDPRMLSGDAMRSGLQQAAKRPFRVTPFFDPAPWGGQWMRQRLGIDAEVPNLGWCFDCVPEENSLVLRFGEINVEFPAMNLVYSEPRRLLGETIYSRFGAEFPIRFDLLDTMGGGNLSLQVHPTQAYAKRTFGLAYTQDESYYLLDAKPGASVYLGFSDGANPAELLEAIGQADAEHPVEVDRYVTRWPAKKHDHFLLPAGIIHCSGADSMVLEISATPYIFTFKLWDWGRIGLDGVPRPTNLEHGRAVLRDDLSESRARSELINDMTTVAEGAGWIEQRTGLHHSQFIETRRHWFSDIVKHHTQGNLNVLNLVEGEQVIVESPEGLFDPMVIHYAETFIVPAAVGAYTIRPLPGTAGETVAVGTEARQTSGRCATIKAFVRPG